MGWHIFDLAHPVVPRNKIHLHHRCHTYYQWRQYTTVSVAVDCKIPVDGLVYHKRGGGVRFGLGQARGKEGGLEVPSKVLRTTAGRVAWVSRMEALFWAILVLEEEVREGGRGTR